MLFKSLQLWHYEVGFMKRIFIRKSLNFVYCTNSQDFAADGVSNAVLSFDVSFP